MASASEPPSSDLAKMKLENGDAPHVAVSPTPPPASTTPGSATPTPGDGVLSFGDAFKAFSKFGDSKSDGKHITLSQSDKWMKQAKVIDGKKITTTDTGIYFKKLKSQKVSIDDYKKFLDDLAKNKKIEVEKIKEKMASCSTPGLHGVGIPKPVSAVERLTDVSKYTGSHKQRFDETGKGKGIAGRKDVADTSGYVTGFNKQP